jgi:ParB family transcriptional regulator, chromosome partitioning protein
MTRRAGLGRGLDALIPGDDRPSTGGVLWISVKQIIPNPRQPRSHFDVEELNELAASIQEYGLIQPLVVTTDSEKPDQYILIAGERRWLAARQSGLELVPAILREASEQQRLQLALVENVQRSNLGPLETAEAYRQLVEDFHLSHEEIAGQVFKSRSSVTNTLRLLKLPEDVRDALADGRISEGHARALLALSTPQAQSAALQSVLSHDLNVRQAEELVKRLGGEMAVHTIKSSLSPELAAMEEHLRGRLGTRVRLTHHRKGGTIIIHYYSDEELNALVEQLLGWG